jgi:hypothetical protein
MNPETSSPSDSDCRWWLSTEGKAEGPYSAGYLVAGLKTNTIPAIAYACPVGGTEWKQLAEWPDFAGVVPSPEARVASLPASSPLDSPFTNPRLPAMANWICVYAIAISPILWFISTFSCGVTGTLYHEESPLLVVEVLETLVGIFVSLGITILLVLGGVRLRALRPSGVSLLKLGFWLDLSFAAADILFGLGVVILFSQESDYREAKTAEAILSFFLFVLVILQLAFELIALIWLHRNGRRLPLTAGA